MDACIASTDPLTIRVRKEPAAPRLQFFQYGRIGMQRRVFEDGNFIVPNGNNVISPEHYDLALLGHIEQLPQGVAADQLAG